MKKHVIAAALATAFAVPAMAQVTISGRVDTSLGNAKSAAGVTTTRVQSNVLTTNQIVIKGSEDLGGGLKAVFDTSTGFASDDSSAMNFGDRGAMVGLQGGFGSLMVGKENDAASNRVGPTGVTNNIGNLNVIAPRPANAVDYTTPSFSGLRGRLIVSQGINGSGEAKPKANSLNELSAEYTNGALLVIGYQASVKNLASGAYSSTGLTPNIFANSASTTATVPADDKTKETGLRVDYDFGVAKVNFRTVKRDFSSAANSSAEFTDSGIGVSVPLGSGLTGNVDYRNFDSKTNTLDYKVTSATIVKNLSNRTNVYGAYAVRDNNNADKNQTLLAVGIRHSF